MKETIKEILRRLVWFFHPTGYIIVDQGTLKYSLLIWLYGEDEAIPEFPTIFPD